MSEGVDTALPRSAHASSPLEAYALIGDTQSAALVCRNGSLDWLCLPRFDSPACFAALLGGPENGAWQIRPAGEVRRVTRRYRGDTLVLETRFETDDGVVLLLDCMPPRQRYPRVLRQVVGVRGSVAMRLDLRIRFDYGKVVPWVRRLGDSLIAVAGPDALEIRADVPLEAADLAHTADFVVAEGQRVGFSLTWHPSHRTVPPAVDVADAIAATESWWSEWAARSAYDGPWREPVMRSLLTLKALTYEPTGGVIAAPTTSLPEQLGGVRNWDYRYCWLRDAALTLEALMAGGCTDEAVAWRDWLLRAVAGDVDDLQIMYGVAGERRLAEYELDWLAGYEGSRPVRVGNAASGQLQLDVYGEVLAAMHVARGLGMQPDSSAWSIQRHIVDWLESNWREPDEGIWEVRGPRRRFTHSKVMAWVAADRAVRAVEESGLDGDATRWRRLRADIHEEVCREGYDAARGTFTQYYGSAALDASLLLIPKVGFLPAGDPRVAGTVDAIQRELCRDGLVLRYVPDEDAADGLPPGEGAFLPCSFWLVDDLALLGRHEEARALFDRLLSLRNDVGLLAEEYDTVAGRLVGNFPQAFSHLALVASAASLATAAAESAG
jgi:GH15 family glucan-1,4-alpha-glucosidase